MSWHCYFSMSTGFSSPQVVPKGTLKRIWSRIEYTEQTLGLRRQAKWTPEGEAQRPGWDWEKAGVCMLATAGSKTDTALPQWWLADRERDSLIASMGLAVRLHNDDVRWLYKDLKKWQKCVWGEQETEVISVEESIEFWGGLKILELPKELWDREHYTDHMEHLHCVLTTGESRGLSLDCKPFNAKQASAVLGLFEAELDQWGFDARFEIPLDENLKPYDFIRSSYDGGYDWCEQCGPILADDFHARCRICPRAKKGKCDLKNSHPAEFEEDEEEQE